MDKNIKLKKERGISFDDIVFYIENGNLIQIIENPNYEKYSGQRIFVLNINDYIYVPFVENDEEIFLKTIIPSRKLTEKYIRRNK